MKKVPWLNLLVELITEIRIKEILLCEKVEERERVREGNWRKKTRDWSMEA